MSSFLGEAAGTASFLTVGELTAYVRASMLQDPLLQDLWVQGEVSQASLSRAGHLFFLLRDESASLKAVVWAPASYRLRPALCEGKQVLVHGRLDVYAAQGIYQLYVDEAVPLGVGLAYLEFERLRRKLEAEGLFDESRKRPLPRFPKRIGVVTSDQGAARRDIEHVLSRRWPLAEVVLVPAFVQGSQAPETIVAALRRVAAAGVDVIILARGGGDAEALSCFNDERVARAIAAMPVPVVTGIGHETDTTIADFVADCRAPTPTAAAALASPDAGQLLGELQHLLVRAHAATMREVGAKSAALEQHWQRLQRFTPLHSVLLAQVSVERLAERLKQLAANSLRGLGEPLQLLRHRLEASNPLAILARGYAVVHRGTCAGPVVRDAATLAVGELVALRLWKGAARAVIAETAPDLRRDTDQDEG